MFGLGFPWQIKLSSTHRIYKSLNLNLLVYVHDTSFFDKDNYFGHAEEDDLVPQHILIVKVGRLCYLGALETQS